MLLRLTPRLLLPIPPLPLLLQQPPILLQQLPLPSDALNESVSVLEDMKMAMLNFSTSTKSVPMMRRMVLPL
jgi:hypothetical protein